ERVGPRHVVVVLVLPAPDQAAGLIVAACDRLELHLHGPVHKGLGVENAPGKVSVAAALENLARIRRCGVGLIRPGRRTGAGGAAGPTLWYLADRLGIEA